MVRLLVDRSGCVLSEVLHEILNGNPGLSQYSSKGSEGQFIMEGNDTSYVPFWSALLQYNMTTALPHLGKAESLQCFHCLRT